MVEKMLYRNPPGLIARFPAEPCPSCKSMNWWYQPVGGGAWVCGACHPSVEPVVKLKARIMKGNYILNKAVGQILGMDPGPAQDEANVQLMASVAILRKLAQELKQVDKECLYIDQGKKQKACGYGFYCYGCPNDYWQEKELMEQNREVLERVQKGNQVLWEAWHQARMLSDKEFDNIMARIDDKINGHPGMTQEERENTLASLCAVLQHSGYRRCLYTDGRACDGIEKGPDKWFCWVCPK